MEFNMSQVPWRTVAIGAVVFLLGVGAGVTSASDEDALQTAHLEIQTLSDDRDDLQERYDALFEKHEEFMDEYEELADELQEVKHEFLEYRSEVNRVEEKEEKPEKKPSGGGAASTFGEGTFRVGNEIRPGTYKAPGGDGCYWERLSGFSGDFDDIIVNGGFQKNVVVEIQPSDAGFSSSNCGQWTRI